jgi:hypothetical protein
LLARLSGAYGEQVRLKPDAFVIVSGPEYEDMAFVEFDTGSQSRAVMRAKLEAYRRYRSSGQEQGVQDGVFPLVVIITSSPERQAMLQDLLTDLPNRGLATVQDWPTGGRGAVADGRRVVKWLVIRPRPPPVAGWPLPYPRRCTNCNCHEA